MWKESNFSAYSNAPGGMGLLDFAEIQFKKGFAVYEVAKIDVLEKQRDEVLDLLKRIYNAHSSGNSGAFMGEAVLCPEFALEAKEVIEKY